MTVASIATWGLDRRQEGSQGEWNVVTARSTVGPDATVLDEDEMERRYQSLGARQGWAADGRVRTEIERWFTNRGREGVRWLLGRLRDERNVETLDDAAELLASALVERGPWEVVADALRDAPEERRTGPWAETLLRALGWSAPPADQVARAAELAETYAASPDPAIRERAACLAVRWLERSPGAPRAWPACLGHLQGDPDPYVRQALEDELTEASLVPGTEGP